jgi:hypothetical protein
LLWAVIIAAVVFVLRKRLKGKGLRLPGIKRRAKTEVSGAEQPLAEEKSAEQEKE